MVRLKHANDEKSKTDSFRHIVTFFDFVPYKYSCLYLFTEDFLVDSIHGSFINNTCKLKILLKGLECY